jgi:hypothetical protein
VSVSRRVYRPSSRRGEGPLGCVAAVLVALAAGGCTWSFPMASLMPERPETTGSLKFLSPLGPELDKEDWRRAKAALGVALDPQGNGAEVTWDNPDTAMRGSFVPVGAPFAASDEVCRAFLAVVAAQEATKRLQGTACRTGGEWAVKDVRPWKSPG